MGTEEPAAARPIDTVDHAAEDRWNSNPARWIPANNGLESGK
jgi:hypothetical protein